MGFRGVTTNPPLSLQAIQADPDYWAEEIRKIAAERNADDIEDIYWTVYLDVVRKGAAMIRRSSMPPMANMAMSRVRSIRAS